MFITLFLFNLLGYKCWHYYLQQRANASFEARIDKEDYNEQDLITFKIPLSNPYQVNWQDFERVNGEISIRGVIYKYVKRKIQDGQLIVLCLPHYKKMQLAMAFSKFSGHGSGNGAVVKPISPDEYEQCNYSTACVLPVCAAPQRKLYRSSPLSAGNPELQPRPPRYT